MSEQKKAPALPGEVWRGDVWREDFRMNEIAVVCIVDGSIIVLQPVYFVVNEWQVARVAREFEAIRAWALSLRASLAATLREADRLRHGQEIEGDFVCPNEVRAEQAEAEARSFQRACGSLDGATLSAALAKIKHILREGDGIIPSPCGGIPDAAVRVVKRAETAEKLAAAERAYRVAIQARETSFMCAAEETPEVQAAYGRALVGVSVAARALIEAGGKP